MFLVGESVCLWGQRVYGNLYSFQFFCETKTALKNEIYYDFLIALFSWAPKSLQVVTTAMKLKRCLLLRRKVVTNLDSILKNRDITLLTKVRIVKAMVFPVVMYGCELDHKEGWVLKNWCVQTVGLEKTLDSPLDSKEIKPTNPKGNQPWIFIGRTDAAVETTILWPPDVKNWLI